MVIAEERGSYWQFKYGNDPGLADLISGSALTPVAESCLPVLQDVMTVLIEAKASTETQNIDTLTPCSLASEIGKKHLVAFFGKKLSEATLKTLGKSKIRN